MADSTAYCNYIVTLFVVNEILDLAEKICQGQTRILVW